MHACTVVSSGPDDTAALARSLAEQVRAGDVVLLVGALAAGKTTFVTALAAALGYTGPVTSPTFTLANFYPAPGLSVLHADTYRLSAAADFADLGLAEFMPDALAVIEWGDLVAGEFDCYLRIALASTDPGRGEQREITIGSDCDRWRPVIDQLQRSQPRLAGERR